MRRISGSGATISVGALVIAALACGRSKDVPDDKLGGLVVPEVKDSDKRIDIPLAAKDPAELSRVLAQPYKKVVDGLGPHVVTIASSSQIVGADALTETTTIEIGDRGAFHGLYTNSADYGRETLFVDGWLYLRPRYQRWHGRKPDSAEEPTKLRDAYFESIYATWDLLAPAAQLTDKGPVQIAGRVGRKIEITQASRPRPNPEETLSQRRWRQSRTIDGVTGEVVVDAEKGVVLAARLGGNVSFQKDGARYSMAVSVDAKLDKLGTATPIVPPPTGEVVATPERLREVDDRDYLLQNIAPPLRRNPDGTAATPQPAAPPTPAPASPAPVEDKKKKADRSDEKKPDKADNTDEHKPDKADKADKADKIDKIDEKSSDKKADSKADKKPETKNNDKDDKP